MRQTGALRSGVAEPVEVEEPVVPTSSKVQHQQALLPYQEGWMTGSARLDRFSFDSIADCLPHPHFSLQTLGSPEQKPDIAIVPIKFDYKCPIIEEEESERFGGVGLNSLRFLHSSGVHVMV